MQDDSKIEKPWWREGVMIFVKVSSYIAFPVIISSLIGKYLDKKYDSGLRFFLIFIALGFITTIYLIWKEMKIYKKKVEQEEKDKQN